MQNAPKKVGGDTHVLSPIVATISPGLWRVESILLTWYRAIARFR
jgi:hypothetical protein